MIGYRVENERHCVYRRLLVIRASRIAKILGQDHRMFKAMKFI